jgi:hypothetical protein
MPTHEPWRRLLLRTRNTADAYEAAKQAEAHIKECRLCSDHDTLEDYSHWRLMPNRFPYDRYFATSHMLVLKRHSDERGLTFDELDELRHLKQTTLGEHYDLIMENLPKQQSIPHHTHYHLISLKRVEE